MKTTIKFLSVFLLITFIAPYAFVSCSSGSTQLANPITGIGMFGLNHFFAVDPMIVIIFIMSIIGIRKLFDNRLKIEKQMVVSAWIYGIIFILFVLLPLYIKYNPLYEDMVIRIAWGAYLATFIAFLISWLSTIKLLEPKLIKENRKILSNKKYCGLLLVYILLASIIYMVLFSKLHYSNNGMITLIYYMGAIATALVINRLVGYRKKVAINSKVLIGISISLAIIIQFMIIFNFNFMLEQYYKEYNYYTVFHFKEYTQMEGSKWKVYSKLIAQGIYPYSIVKGIDTNDSPNGNIYLDENEYNQTVYQINNTTYIIYDWHTDEILDRQSKDILLKQCVESLDSNEPIRVQVSSKMIDYIFEDDYIRFNIVPENGKVKLEEPK